jgi:uncharacterized repeat protein (TIGR03803 family)
MKTVTMKILRIAFIIVVLVVAGQAFNANALSDNVLHSFSGATSDGAIPYGALVQGSDGNFYGTTTNGGKYNVGTVFGISPAGIQTFLYSFGSYSGDGNTPVGGLLQSNGCFYGTTAFGGKNGYGTVFQIIPANTPPESILYSFGTSANDGIEPYAGLVLGSDGNFYGTTVEGGQFSQGTVFGISPSGIRTFIYHFGSYSGDGEFPGAALVEGTDGNLYGTTMSGGANGCGTVFQIILNQSPYEFTIWSFGSSNDGQEDGQAPQTGLVQGCDGNFYGTTAVGGKYGEPFGYGIVFQINLTQTTPESILYNFAGPDGAGPRSTLMQGSDGNLYGTTGAGGAFGYGTVFQFIPPNPVSSYTKLYDFEGSADDDGDNPCGAALVQGLDGNLYGTTTIGGKYGYGTVFELPVGLMVEANYTPVMHFHAPQCSITIASIAGATYQLETCGKLFPPPPDWQPYGSPVKGTGCDVTVTDPTCGQYPQKFYRWQIIP